jgi:hypothetical protein
MSNGKNAEHKEKDQDCGKGAVEANEPDQSGNTSLSGQLGHRGEPALVKESDSDFPEPGQNPEHSGEPQEPEKKSA